MNTIYNPYQEMISMMKEVKNILLEIKEAPKEDYTFKFYTIDEAAEILSVDTQTIRNYGKNGFIEIESLGPRKKLVQHFQIFNSDNTIKNFKYKRKA